MHTPKPKGAQNRNLRSLLQRGVLTGVEEEPDPDEDLDRPMLGRAMWTGARLSYATVHYIRTYIHIYLLLYTCVYIYMCVIYVHT